MVEKKCKKVISKVIPNSKAHKLGIEVGDKLLTINHQPIEDIIEYMFFMADEYVELGIKKVNGIVKEYKIYKDYDEDIGIEFESPIIDQVRSCKNKCIFCFIDQLPPNMRKTLYFKDDDSRLSFLQGNFVTLTNMSDYDIDKIIKYRISPINVSIHTTDSELRKKMLNNNTAGNIYERLIKLCNAQIKVNGQIVLCPDINDKEHLDHTIDDLVKLHPNMASVAIVPVGITKFRKNLYPLKTFNKESANKVIRQIEKWQEKILKKFGTRFVFLADEFYVIAERPLPHYEHYEEFSQIENGVGLMAKFKHEFLSHLKTININISYKKTVSIITGKAAKQFMSDLCKKIEEINRNISINVFEIENMYFGETITVSGLITGRDIMQQLKKQRIGEKLIIPDCMLKAGEPIFLDDMHIKDLEKALEVPVVISKVNGKDFIETIIG